MSYAPIYNELVEKATTKPLEYRYSELWEALLRAEKYIVKMEKLAPRPEGNAPVDPESEAANPVWDLVIDTCAKAWGPGKLQWSQSPTELIVDIINARDEALDDVKRLHAEKMKFFERVIELERQLAAALSPLDAQFKETK